VFLWGSTLFLGSRLAASRTFAIFIDRRGEWIADAVCALLGDDRVVLDAAHQGLKTAGARWPRYAWLPVPEARALKHALDHARRAGHRPRISIAAFLVDVCKIPQKDVAGSLIWPSSRVGFRTGRRRQLIHEVSRSWYGTGPRRWPVDPHRIQEGQRRRAFLWEAWLLVVIVAVIFIALELGQLLLGGSP
jgi:hypothetical protein